ncbi:putative Kinase binding protein [Trypanosoma vivax]|nr:hypothetical protein TRVL_03602 [Trypanosoma vivax]KAH8616899.1 putative Kinase binding protein [Trypanosoma vivax]
MERIGEFFVAAYHNVRDAASLFDQCKENRIDAAVIDAAYIVSRLHLAVALHRASGTPLTLEAGEGTGSSSEVGAAKRKQTPSARDVFAALSHTRNLDRVLERLACSKTTTSVVIVLYSQQHAATVVGFVHGEPHALTDLRKYCNEGMAREFYSVGDSESDLEAAVIGRLAISDA